MKNRPRYRKILGLLSFIILLIFSNYIIPNFSEGKDAGLAFMCKNNIGFIYLPYVLNEGTIVQVQDNMVQVQIKITENLSAISSFGLDLTYDNTFFSYNGISKGSLVSDWALVDANEITPGTIRIGGYSGEGTTIPACSTGFIALLDFAIIYSSSSSGDTSQVCLSNYVDDISSLTPQPYCADFTFEGKDDFLGTWTGQGVYCRISDTGAWVKMASPATKVDAGDLNNDSTDDLVGIWPTQGGVWVKYGVSGNWALLSSTADWIGCGDMNGDGRDDLIGSWASQGVYYKNSADDLWVKMASPATKVDAGDLDNDGTDDLIGIWPAQGGVWVKYGVSGNWALLSSTADWIGCGDMNGDGRDDLIGSWTGQGVYYRNSADGDWVLMATAATQVAAGDIDGDGTDDLLGIWPGQGGVWIKYSSTSAWEKLSTTADWIAAGKMSGGGATSSLARLQSLGEDYAMGPGRLFDFEDFSSTGPGGWDFVCLEQEDLIPGENASVNETMVPGPGDPGFKCTEQENLFPHEGHTKKLKKKQKLL
jgi:hypothetical protein